MDIGEHPTANGLSNIRQYGETLSHPETAPARGARPVCLVERTLIDET